MSEQDFLIKANSVLQSLEESNKKLEKRNKNAWTTIALLFVFFIGAMGTGIVEITTLSNIKADKETIGKVYLKIERYEQGQQMTSKLSASYMAKMAAYAGGDQKLIDAAEKEYNYHIREIIEFSGTRSIK